MPLNELVLRIKDRLAGSAYANEAAVSVGVVLPVLRNLGWDDSDPGQVIPEYSLPNGRVDFALFANPRQPSVLVEVKGAGRIGAGDRQVFEYAFHKGVPICLLTDGREWSFYYPPGEGDYSERRVRKVDFIERDVSNIVSVLTRYLDRERVRTGAARDAVDVDFRDLRSRREAERTIPKAWASLVNGPEELLIELLQDQTESMAGVRPSSLAILNFLKGLTPSPPGTAEEPLRTLVSKEREKSPPAQQVVGSPQSGTLSPREVEYELFGQKKIAKSATEALLTILRQIAERNPQRLEAIASRARGRSRNHIGRTPEEIYPKRPDLARAEEFFDGWLIGLNIANREKMRIIKGACETVGLRFGEDIKIDLPNA